MTKIRSTDSSQIRDRRTSGGGGGGLGGLKIPLGAGGGLLGILVAVAALILPRVLGGGSAANVASDGQGAPTEAAADGTCSSDLEQIVCGATIDIQSYWTAALPKFYDGTAYQMTSTEFFTGSTSTGCGNATSDTGPFYCPADSIVYLDLEFMQELERRLIGGPNDLAEQYIVAHEYGHHIQNLLGTNEQVSTAEQNDPDKANQYSVALELQADCYAGVWVGDVNRRGLLEGSSEIDEALDAAAGVGDDRIQEGAGQEVNPDSWTHGSAEQRQTWFMQGFNSQDPTTCDTFAEIL